MKYGKFFFNLCGMMLVLSALMKVGYAQDLHWSHSMGGVGFDMSNEIHVFENGDFLVLGEFEDSVNFDAGGSMQIHTSNGSSDLFLSRFSPDGAVQWTKTWGSSASDEAGGVTADASGNIYISGTYSGFIDLDPGANSQIVNVIGPQNVFLLKLDAFGNFIWGEALVSNEKVEAGKLAWTAPGVIYFVGGYSDSLKVGGPAGNVVLNHPGQSGAFIAKYLDNGLFDWIEPITNSVGEVVINDVTTGPSASVWVTGSFTNMVVFSPDDLVEQHTSQGITDVFVAVYDDMGELKWSKSVGGVGMDDGNTIQLSPNSVLVGGVYEQNVDFDPGPVQINQSASGARSGYVFEWSLFGSFNWVKSLHGTKVLVNDLIRAFDGTLYVLGDFEGNVDLDPSIDTYLETAAGSSDFFLTRWNDLGDFRGGFSVGKSQAEQSVACGVDVNQFIYVTGGFLGTTNLDPAQSTPDHLSNGNLDVFTARYCMPPPAPDTIYGPSDICPGDSFLVFSVSPATNANYFWNLPVGFYMLSGDSSATLTVLASDTATSGLVEVFAYDSCGISAVTSLNLLVNPLVGPVTGFSGPTEICVGDTVTYFLNSVVGASEYNWNYSSGLLEIANTDTTFTVTAILEDPQAYVEVAVQGKCNDTTVNVFTEIHVSDVPGFSGPILGPGTLCPNQLDTFSVSIDSSITEYLWSFPLGFVSFAMGAGDQQTVIPSQLSPSGFISVSGTNQCGTSMLADSVYVIVQPPLPTPDSIFGPEVICPGIGTAQYSIPTISGATEYIWHVSTGLTVSAGQGNNMVEVIISPGFSGGTIAVTAVNECGPTNDSVTLVLSSGDVPGAIGPITGENEICGSATEIYAVPTSAEVDSYIWSVPQGALVIDGASTDEIIVVFDGTFSGGDISVIPVNECGMGTQTTYTIGLGTPPNQPDSIQGPLSICQGESGIVFSTNGDPEADSYQWSFPAGMNVVGSANQSSVTVDVDGIFTGGDITVQAINACGISPFSNSLTLVQGILPSVPQTITGSQGICAGSGPYTYSVPQSGDATFYQWILPSGVNVVGGDSSNAISVTFDLSFTTGLFEVYAVNACGSSVVSQTVFIESGVLPSAASSIAGPSKLCPNETQVLYSTAPILGADNYEWLLPNGMEVISGSNSDSVFIEIDTSFAGGDILVMGTNACGDGAFSAPFTVNLDPLPDAAGTISGPISACYGTSGLMFSVPPVPAGVQYLWDIPSGTVITSGIGTHNIVLDLATAQAGDTLHVRALNGCGEGESSPGLVFNIELFPEFPGPITGINTICEGVSGVVYQVDTANYTDSYNWTVPVGMGIDFGNGTPQIYLDCYSGANGGYVTVYGENACGQSTVDSVFVEVNPLPGPANIPSGSMALCPDATGELYSIPPISNATEYHWTFPQGFLTFGTNTNQVTIDLLPNAQSGFISVYGENACGEGDESSISLTINPFPDPAGPVFGEMTVCEGATEVDYSTVVIPEADYYVWSIPLGTYILDGDSSTNISVNYDFEPEDGVISVYGVNECGEGLPSGNYFVTIEPLPGSAGGMSGQDTLCANTFGWEYEIEAVSNALGYLWDKPLNTIVSGGAQTPSLILDFPDNAQSGWIACAGVNACGIGEFSDSLYVSVIPVPAQPVITEFWPDSMTCEGEGDSYQWFIFGAPITQTDQTIQAIAGIPYSCVIENNGCFSAVSDTHSLQFMVGVENTSLNKTTPDFELFPNPSKGKVNLLFKGFEGTPLVLNIKDAVGNSIQLVDLSLSGRTGEPFLLNMDTLPAGLYFVQFTYQGRTYSRKIILTP